MQIFLDTADLNEIQKWADIIDGVTTNPSLLSKSAEGDPYEHLRKICSTVKGPVSAEVTATDEEGIISQAKSLAEISPNIVVKIPMTPEGIRATAKISDKIKVNVTLIFSPTQALLAMKAGAYFISPFVGRLDDISSDGLELIRKIVRIKNNYNFRSKVLVASIRSPEHVLESALAGADIVTVPPKIFAQLFEHPLTTKGLEKFLEDWKKKFDSK